MRWRLGLTLRAAVAVPVQLPVLAVAAGVTLLGGLVWGVLWFLLLLVVFSVVVPESLFPVAANVATLAIPLGSCWGLWKGIEMLREERRAFRDRVFRYGRDPDPADDAHLTRTVERLAALAGRPTPEVRFRYTEEPLCMTVRDGGTPVIVVSTDLTRRLSRPEVEAVLAHEVAHVANGDHSLMDWLVSPLLYLGDLERMPVRHWLNPVAVAIYVPIRAAERCGRAGVGLFSRGRELAADRTAATLTGNPLALASALETLSRTTEGPPDVDFREHSLAVDATNVYPVVDPGPNASGGLMATHPSTEERVERLRQMADEA